MVMVSSEQQFTCLRHVHTDVGGSIMSGFTTFCQIPWDWGAVVGSIGPGWPMPLPTAFYKQFWVFIGSSTSDNGSDHRDHRFRISKTFPNQFRQAHFPDPQAEEKSAVPLGRDVPTHTPD